MEKGKVRFPLSRKITLLVLVIAISLSSVLIVSSYFHYRSEMYEHYEEFAMNIGAIAASQLNPDNFQTYLDTKVPDEEYMEAYTTLCQIREHGGIMYLYVVKPEVDEVWYIMDTDPSDAAIPLGYHEPYYAGAFAEHAEMMARGEKIEPLISDEEFGWLMSVYYPMKTSAGEPAGYVGVDILMTEVMNDLHNFALQMIVLMAILTVAFSLVLIRITSKTVAEPIQKLSKAAEQLVEEEQAGGNSDTSIFTNLTIRSKDEVGALYDSLSQMERDINVYIRDLLTVTAEKERIGAELSVATQIQADMLPSIFPAFPERKEFDIFATMTPAKEVGGDFYDFFLVDDDHLALVMADVSGKGIPAAMFMVIAKTLIKNRAQMGDSPGEILRNVNNQLCDGNEAELFVTVWLAIIELSTGKGVAANAGHEHPAFCKENGEYELVIYRHSLPVATMEGVRFKERSFQLQPGDTLFVYTDGVTEATNLNNELFGTERMLEALNSCAHGSPQEQLSCLRQAIDGFVGEAPQFDDITMMCVHYSGPELQKGEEMTLKAEIENLDRVLSFVDEYLEKMDCPRKLQIQIDIAVEEIFVNIASYAYEGGSGMATIQVESESDPLTAVITFEDTGIPYDPLAKEDPDVSLPAVERQVGGLGVYMVKKSMDDVIYEYRDGKNILKLKKVIRP